MLEVVNVVDAGGNLAVVLVALGGDKNGSSWEVTKERGGTVGNDLDLKLDGGICRVPPAAAEGTSILSSSEVDVLPHVNAGVVSAGHVKVDVDGVGCKAGGVPFDVKLLASGNVLVHGRGLVEAASLTGYGNRELAGIWRNEGWLCLLGLASRFL